MIETLFFINGYIWLENKLLAKAADSLTLSPKLICAIVILGSLHFKDRNILLKRQQPCCVMQQGCRSMYCAGGDLLSHLRSTIGAGELNFSVRNGKR